MAASGVNLFHLPSETPINNEVKFSPNAGAEGSEDEDYSASLSAVLRQRRASVRRSRKGRARRASSPFLTDELTRSRRRSSVFTTSSGDTAISMEECQPAVVTQEQIFENIRLHKEVLGSVKQQPLGLRRKLKIVHQAKAYIKRHEGQLQERLAQSKCTRDIYARFNILLNSKWQLMKREAANTSNLLIPWELRIKEIESHFGSVVASYFTFLRWLFWVNLVIGFILLVFVIVPEYLTANPQQDGERKIIMEEERRNASNLLMLWEFEGILKFSPIFYGYYSNVERPQYRMPLAYFLTGLAVYIYSFVAILRKMAENSRMSKLSEKEDECIFSWKLFTGWDFMIGNTETAHNRIASVILGFKEALLEEAEKKKALGNWRIISLRAIVNICVVILLAVSAYAVVTVVSRSDDNSKPRSWWRENETTVVVTVISITFPVFFELLGFLEHYHPRKQLRLQLARIMLLNLLNLYSLIFALFSKIEGMSDELCALKPSLDMSATTTPNSSFNVSESWALNLPISCTEQRVSCETCEILPKIEINMATTDFTSNNALLTKPTYYFNNGFQHSMNKNHNNNKDKNFKESPLVGNLIEHSTTPNVEEDTMNNQVMYDFKKFEDNELSTVSSSDEINYTENKPTGVEISTLSNNNNVIENITLDSPNFEANITANDDIDYYGETMSSSTATNEEQESTKIMNFETTTMDSILLLRQEIERLHLIAESVGGGEETPNEYDYDTDNFYEYDNETDFVQSEATTSTSITLVDSVLLQSNTTNSFENSTEIIEKSTLFEQNETDYTVESNTLTNMITEAESDSDLAYKTSSITTPSTRESIGLYNESTIFETDLITTTETDGQYITNSVELDNFSDFTSSSNNGFPEYISSSTMETVVSQNRPATAAVDACPNNFNCTMSCQGLNVTQVVTVSNCKIIEKKCYVTKCDHSEITEMDKTNKTAVDIAYMDHNRKMYNLTTVTRKKLLKLCWETMFGQELVKLTMMDLVFVLLSTLFMDFFRALFVRYMNRCWCWDLEKKFPEYGDFKIAENILHLINNQGMVWMGMFFSPGLVVLNVAKLMIMMYLRSWAVMTCNVPHEVVFRVSKSNNFYLALLLTMLFLCVLPVGYTIVWVTPSWHCGPFSEYDKIYKIITNNIYKILPKSLNFALEYIASPAIVIPLLVLLILIIYYLTSLTNSLREANNDLKIQLRRERTEERRKMFQLADTRRRVGSSGIMDNTPFAKWKKALPSLPMGKSIDSDDRRTSTAENVTEPLKVSKKKGGIFAKIVSIALDKKTDEVVPDVKNVSQSSSNNIDDETDTDFHETLPKEVLKIKDLFVKHIENKKKSNVEFKTDSYRPKLQDMGLKVKLEKEHERTEKKANIEKQKYDTPNEPTHSHKPVDDEVRGKKIDKKQISETSTQSKQSDSTIGSVIPVITISTTESDEEFINQTHPKKVEKDVGDQSQENQESSNSEGLRRITKSTSDFKSLKRQKSVESINEQKSPKEKKGEEGHKYQYSL